MSRLPARRPSPPARRRPFTALLGILTMFAGALLMAGPAFAQDDTATVAGSDGETVTVEWTGTVPPGLGEGMEHCTDAPASDSHTVEIAVPAGVYDDFDVRFEATITPTGPSGGASDVVTTVVRPDGTAVTTDSGFVGVAETVGFSQPAAGTYTIVACAYLSANPAQSYTGTLTLTTTAPVPETVVEPPCTVPSRTPKFTEQYIDETRAGGEPMIITHPTTGELLWGSHAGTTHFYSPAAPSETTSAFVENYEGQTYYYFSPDGEEWTFVPREGPSESEVSPVAGVPATGFSDPEFAVDAAGNVFVSEINLANIAVYKSTDAGHTYALVNPISFSVADRQWMAADREDELYMAASGFGGGPFPNLAGQALTHFISKSTDGGLTWDETLTIDPIVGDIDIDQDRGILYSLHESGGTLSMAVWRDIRVDSGAFDNLEIHPIASGLGLNGVQRLIDPTFDLDAEGNLYVTWSDNGQDVRPAGIYYAYSTDQGTTWSLPHRVDPGPEADVWPWITVGEPGDVTVTWLQGDAVIEGELPGEEGGDDVTWSVAVATTDTGLGCSESGTAGFAVSQASQEHVHTGTICQHGTTCQADATDRRLGDYFSATTTGDGLVHIAVSDTRKGGAVSLPLHIRQLAADETAPPSDAAPAPDDTAGEDDEGAAAPDTPVTGGGLAVFLVGALLLGAAWRGRRTG